MCREEDGSPRQKYSENIDRMLCVFPYQGNFKALLGSYKFKKSVVIANYFTFCFVTILKEFAGLSDLCEAALVPVPPRPGKIKKQGWDQIEFLAKKLTKYPDTFPVTKCLKRLPSRTQKELSREERSKNLKGRILCVKKPPQIAILFDDVVTTGATLKACAEALLEGGTEKVLTVCLFFD